MFFLRTAKDWTRQTVMFFCSCAQIVVWTETNLLCPNSRNAFVFPRLQSRDTSTRSHNMSSRASPLSFRLPFQGALHWTENWEKFTELQICDTRQLLFEMLWAKTFWGNFSRWNHDGSNEQNKNGDPNVASKSLRSKGHFVELSFSDKIVTEKFGAFFTWKGCKTWRQQTRVLKRKFKQNLKACLIFVMTQQSKRDNGSWLFCP